MDTLFSGEKGVNNANIIKKKRQPTLLFHVAISVRKTLNYSSCKITGFYGTIITGIYIKCFGNCPQGVQNYRFLW